MKPARGLKVAILAGTLVVVGAAPTASAGAGSEAAYVTGAPVPGWLGLATTEGRDAIELGDDCQNIEPGVNVVQLMSDPFDLTLQMVDPILGPQADRCVVVKRLHMSDTPCARDPAGSCDVAFS